MNDLATTFLDTARAMTPELILLAGGTLLVLWGCFARNATSDECRATRRKSLIASAIILLAACAAYFFATPNTDVNSAAVLVNDEFARVLRPTGLVVGIALLILMAEQMNPRYSAEQAACLLFTIAGMNFVACANDLVAMFIALELVSIPTYVLLYLSRSDVEGLEATAKYFLLSIFSSAFLLYGMSILLGCAGSTNFAWLRHSLAEPTGIVSVGMLQVALAMTVAGLSFRIAAVPFHFYAPDVFQGTSTPMAGLLAVLPKVVGFAALLRLVWSVLLGSALHPAFTGLAGHAPQLLAILAVLTMTVGNVVALLQTNLRRLLAYSSIAHAGYMLVGIAVLPSMSPDFSGAQAVLFYLLIYSVMTLGVFGLLLMLRKNDRPVETIDDLEGLSVASPGVALVLAILLFSLTGLPPTGGFWGKFNLFLVAWSTGAPMMRWLAVALAVNAAIGGWYYLRLVRRAYLRPTAIPATATAPGSVPLLAGFVCLCAAGMVGLFFVPNPLWQLLAQVK